VPRILETAQEAIPTSYHFIQTSSRPRKIRLLRSRKEQTSVRLLVVEDETRLAELLNRGLTEEGHAVDIAESAEEALDWINVQPFDAIVLDVLLPGMDGFDCCRVLRRLRVKTPILLLTAKDAVPDRIAGLDAGADDYLVKPFAFGELLARLRALSRRPPDAMAVELSAGNVRLDPSRRRVWKSEAEVFVPNKEFRILEYLMRNPDRILSREMIADHVWNYDFPNVTNVIDVHIRNLRGKLADPYPGGMIETVRGVGYRLRSDK
jgi:two-component system OmpR family response regulator